MRSSSLIALRHSLRSTCAHCLRSPPPSKLFSTSTSTTTSNSSSTSTNPSTTDDAPRPKTFYDLFPLTLPHGPPPSGPFHINPRLLRREFLTLQSRSHPDLSPPALKARAEALSAHINTAYRTLASPLPRAQYLLSLRGLDLAGDEAQRIKDADPQLLELAMLAHEEIDDARTVEDIQLARARNEERIRACEGGLERAFAEDDVEGAVGEAVRLRYLVNIQTALEEWEPGKTVVLQH